MDSCSLHVSACNVTISIRERLACRLYPPCVCRTDIIKLAKATDKLKAIEKEIEKVCPCPSFPHSQKIYSTCTSGLIQSSCWFGCQTQRTAGSLSILETLNPILGSMQVHGSGSGSYRGITCFICPERAVGDDCIEDGCLTEGMGSFVPVPCRREPKKRVL